MDNLTHTLLGAGMANAGLSRQFGRGTTLTLILASNITDLDLLGAMVLGGDSFLHRRMLTHSLFGAPLLAAALAWILRLFYRNQPWRTLFGLSLLGVGGHVFFDLLNSYGVVLLYPFSRVRFELAWVFIIDLALWALLLAPLLLALPRIPFLKLESLSRLSLAGAALYVAVCGAGRWRSGRLLDRIAAAENIRPEFAYVFPEALGPQRFRGVLKERSVYLLYLIRPWTGVWDRRGVFPTDEADPAVRAARASERGRALDWFFRAPVWRRAEDGADVFDLRFHSTVLSWRPQAPNSAGPSLFRSRSGQKTPFSFRVKPD